MDARTKVGVLALVCVAAFGTRDLWGVLVLLAWLAAALGLSRTSVGTVAAGLRPALAVLALSLLANSLVLTGQPHLSVEGLARGALAVARIVAMVGFVLVTSATTLAPSLAGALCWLMRPLAGLGVPVGDVGMTVSLALRFVPLTMEEVDRIRSAQRARGAALDEGGPVRRLGMWAQVLAPLLVALLRRASEVAEAMGDRCYGLDEAVPDMSRLASVDWAVLAASVALCALACVV